MKKTWIIIVSILGILLIVGGSVIYFSDMLKEKNPEPTTTPSPSPTPDDELPPEEEIIKNNVIIGIYNKALTKRGEYNGLIGIELI